MRNDARDELEHIPSLKADPLDHDAYQAPVEPMRTLPPSRAPQASAAPAASGNGALWVVIVALVIALAGLAWWAHQQMSLLGQQLVATQENFARVSEEASGRIQDISGKVVATESSSTTDSESLKLRVKQLEAKLADVGRLQQAFTSQHQSQQSQLGSQGKAAEQLAAQLMLQQNSLTQLQGQVQTQLKALSAQQEARKAELAELAELHALPAQIKSLNGQIAGLKKGGDSSAAIKRLEQELLILRSQQETSPSARQSSTLEFDAYRAQVTRNLTTLQSQIQNLQRQLDGR
jgi:DNA-binding CsgD family transcriptional regulator